MDREEALLNPEQVRRYETVKAAIDRRLTNQLAALALFQKFPGF